MDLQARIKAALDELLDEAVTEGRNNWDGYYGSGNDNSYHMSTIHESESYKKFLELVRV